MRCGTLLSLALVLLAGCSEPKPQTGPQAPWPTAPATLASNWLVQPNQPVDLATSSRECTRLIGSINAGLEHVTATGLKASEAGKDTFTETSLALEAVGRAVEEQVYFTPDLLRLGGLFILIVRSQAQILREIAVTPDGDGARLATLQNQLSVLYQQEDLLLAELNLLCRGEEAPAPAPPSTPEQAPSPVPTPSTAPTPSPAPAP